MINQTILIIFVIVIIIVSLCIFSIWSLDRQISKEIEQEQKERNITENRLTDSLKTLCTQLGIELSYHKELGTAAGRILYYSMNGRLLVDDARIEILEKYKDEPYTLAHELGHYMAIKQRQDDSERGADDEADKLCRLILNKKEQELLSISLRCYFHENERVNGSD